MNLTAGLRHTHGASVSGSSLLILPAAPYTRHIPPTTPNPSRLHSRTPERALDALSVALGLSQGWMQLWGKVGTRPTKQGFRGEVIATRTGSRYATAVQDAGHRSMLRLSLRDCPVAFYSTVWLGSAFLPHTCRVVHNR